LRTFLEEAPRHRPGALPFHALWTSPLASRRRALCATRFDPTAPRLVTDCAPGHGVQCLPESGTLPSYTV